jgi:hypothetical protein
MQKTQVFRKGIGSEVVTDSDKKESSLLKRIALWGGLLLFMFMLGFVPPWLSGRETLRQRDAAQANLRLSQLQNRLATAALNARRGEYEPARNAASDFFTDLRAEVDREESGFNRRQHKAVKAILTQRDEVITLLARSDAAAVERLTDLYLNYVQATNPSALKTP